MRFLLLLYLGLCLACGGDTFAQEKRNVNILFLIADDWSFGHAGIYGNSVVQTPNINAVAGDGAVFMNAFAAAPSCTPSRAAILTGRFPHELEQGANLWGYLPRKYDNYTEILRRAGYHVGLTGKGWGPGNFVAGEYEHNPAGKSYKDFKSFLADRPDGMPFCYWFGSRNPHRPYAAGAGIRSRSAEIPAWLPGVAEVKADILDYYYEVEQFDDEVGEIIDVLKANGEYEHTFIVITGDNGMPFPRAKANLYDPGSKIPLIITLKGVVEHMRINEFVSLTDIAPTILELSEQTIPDKMSGSSLWPLLRKQHVSGRDMVFIERERHANVRKPELGYPARAIRTHDYLYIINYKPERWPAGDPTLYHSVGPYGDVDDSPSKQYILDHRADPAIAPFFTRAFAKRPADELYDLKADPYQLHNVAGDKKYRKILAELKKQLRDWQLKTGDPRGMKKEVLFDEYPYFGPPIPGAPSTYQPDSNR